MLISIYNNFWALIYLFAIFGLSYFVNHESKKWNVGHFFAIHALIFRYLESGDSDASNGAISHDYSPYIEELAL